MPQVLIPTENRVYRVSPDTPRSPSEQLRVYVHGRMIDEITGISVSAPVTIMTRETGYVARVTQDNFFAVAAVARKQLIGLGTGPRPINMELRAPGYISLALRATIPVTPGFPAQLPAPVDLGTVALHRDPVAIVGRVVEEGPVSSALSGATVRVIGIQSKLPPVNSTASFGSPDLVALGAPLHFPRSISGIAAGKAGVVSLTTIINEDKRLRSAANASSDRLSLDNRVGLTLSAGDLLRIDVEDSAAEEIIPTAKVQGASTPGQPCEVVLALRLQRRHPPGALVRRVVSTLPGAIKNLTREAVSGDQVLFLSDLNGWQAADALAVLGGASAEHHRFSHFITTTNVDGFYRLPPISRIAVVRLEARKGTKVKTKEWSIKYGESINFVNFRL